MSNTSIDRFIWKFYKSLGLKIGTKFSFSSFDRAYYVATYGETIVQAHYSKKLVKELDNFFKKGMKSMNLRDLSDIVNKKVKIDLTVIKNINMAKQINKSIISQIKESNL